MPTCPSPQCPYCAGLACSACFAAGMSEVDCKHGIEVRHSGLPKQDRTPTGRDVSLAAAVITVELADAGGADFLEELGAIIRKARERGKRLRLIAELVD